MWYIQDSRAAELESSLYNFGCDYVMKLPGPETSSVWTQGNKVSPEHFLLHLCFDVKFYFKINSIFVGCRERSTGEGNSIFVAMGKLSTTQGSLCFCKKPPCRALQLIPQVELWWN